MLATVKASPKPLTKLTTFSRLHRKLGAMIWKELTNLAFSFESSL
jgi:hypothetical protein